MDFFFFGCKISLNVRMPHTFFASIILNVFRFYFKHDVVCIVFFVLRFFSGRKYVCHQRKIGKKITLIISHFVKSKPNYVLALDKDYGHKTDDDRLLSHVIKSLHQTNCRVFWRRCVWPCPKQKNAIQTIQRFQCGHLNCSLLQWLSFYLTFPHTHTKKTYYLTF